MEYRKKKQNRLMHACNKTLLIIHKTKQKQLYQDYKKTTTTKTIKTKDTNYSLQNTLNILYY